VQIVPTGMHNARVTGNKRMIFLFGDRQGVEVCP